MPTQDPPLSSSSKLLQSPDIYPFTHNFDESSPSPSPFHRNHATTKQTQQHTPKYTSSHIHNHQSQNNHAYQNTIHNSHRLNPPPMLTLNIYSQNECKRLDFYLLSRNSKSGNKTCKWLIPDNWPFSGLVWSGLRCTALLYFILLTNVLCNWRRCTSSPVQSSPRGKSKIKKSRW